MIMMTLTIVSLTLREMNLKLINFEYGEDDGDDGDEDDHNDDDNDDNVDVDNNDNAADGDD